MYTTCQNYMTKATFKANLQYYMFSLLNRNENKLITALSRPLTIHREQSN